MRIFLALPPHLGVEHRVYITNQDPRPFVLLPQIEEPDCKLTLTTKTFKVLANHANSEPALNGETVDSNCHVAKVFVVREVKVLVSSASRPERKQPGAVGRSRARLSAWRAARAAVKLSRGCAGNLTRTCSWGLCSPVSGQAAGKTEDSTSTTSSLPQGHSSLLMIPLSLLDSCLIILQNVY